MGFLSLYDGVETIDLSDLDPTIENYDATAGKPVWWVKVRKCLSNGEMDYCKDALSRLIDGKAAPDMAAYQQEMVVASIVEWNLTDEQDQVIPLAPAQWKHQAVRKLPERVFSRIYQKVNDLNSDRTVDERRQFRGRADRSAESRERRSAQSTETLDTERSVAEQRLEGA